jgi:protein-tyrosine kinase
MSDKPKSQPSLIERAAKDYDFTEMFRPYVPSEPAAKPPVAKPQADKPVVAAPKLAPIVQPAPVTRAKPAVPAVPGAIASVDLHMLRDTGFIVPGSPPTALSEEFRLIKRQILLKAFESPGMKPVDRGRIALICSAQPNEGKTFCAINLALSMASESELEVLLVDADVAKPEVLSTLGLAGSAGLMDALADPSIDAESLIIRTDIPNLSVLPAGRQTNNDTELLASARTRSVIDALAAQNPRRIIVFDSAPALAASPASVLALHVGQVLLVVRADQTTESELRDTLTLVDACPHVQLMLNAVTFSGSNRKFGSYYGFGE